MLQIRRRTPVALVLGHRRWFLSQAAIVASGIFVYFGVRGLTDGSPAIAREHARSLVSLERHLGVAWEATMQGWVIGSSALSTLANWMYIWGHWPVIIATMAWLAFSHPARFLRLRNAMLISGGIGMVAFTVFPVAPPRLAGLGLVDTVTEKSDAYRVLQPPAFVNQYAAMPSLHVGWDLLVGLAIAGAAAGAWMRWIGRLMPLLMAFAVIVTANHYVVDVVAGVSIAMIGFGGAVLIERSCEIRAQLEPRASRLVRRALAHASARTAPRDAGPNSDKSACGFCG